MKPLLVLLAGICITAIPSIGRTAILFEENWSDISPGSNPIVTERWVQPRGQSSQFSIAQAPFSSLTGQWLTASYPQGGEVLPMIITANSFALPVEGLRISLDVVFANQGQADNYLRVGIQNAAAKDYSNNYWFEIWGSFVQIVKVNPTSSVTTLKSYTFKAGDWEAGTTGNFAMSVKPGASGDVIITLSLNGNEVLTYVDTAKTSTFDEGFKVFIASRQPRESYAGNLKVESIPEGGSYALLFSGVGALLGLSRYGSALVRN